MSSFLCFGQSVGQTSSIEDYLANSHYPSSGWRTRPMSDSQTLKITWSASVWIHVNFKHNLCGVLNHHILKQAILWCKRCLDHWKAGRTRDTLVASARLWLNPEPNVKLSRLSGQITCSRLWLNLVGPTNFEDWACSPHPSGQIDTQRSRWSTLPSWETALPHAPGTQLRICDFLVDSLAIFEVPSIDFHSLVLFLCCFDCNFHIPTLPSLLVVKCGRYQSILSSLFLPTGRWFPSRRPGSHLLLEQHVLWLLLGALGIHQPRFLHRPPRLSNFDGQIPCFVGQTPMSMVELYK